MPIVYMNTKLNNLGKGVLHGVLLFVALYGASLVHLIPSNIIDFSVGSLLALIISFAQHSVSTPAGSTVVTHA